ncbi:MAG TPA: glycosyltransferase family 2 protein [Gemmataceae bacterium]|nr:glycosyltransferase family 2 protein [Gemmataceae bacterium]
MSDAAEGLTLVLPVFDQEKTLAKAVSSWVPTLHSLNRPYELLIVDDGSLDGTKAQAEVLATRNGRIRVLSHPERKGYGACVRTALEAATQPLFFYTSADHGWNPADLPRMIKSVDFRDEYTGKRVELVNGHRRGTRLPTARRWLSRLYRGFVRVVFGYLPDPPKGWLGTAENRYWWKCRLLFGIRVGDVNSKFKLFRRSVFDRIVIQSDGEFIHAELLAKANFLGCMMDEIVLGDRQVPPPLPDLRKELRRVFRNPKFRSPVPTPGVPEPKRAEPPPPAPAEPQPNPAP